MMWKESWDPVSTSTASGGQGVVTKVIHRTDHTEGALKELHPEHIRNTERRFRMQQEANALLALSGQGVPRVLETNADEWQDKNKILYIVMDWVDGPTLTRLVSGNSLSLDDVLLITRSLLDTLDRCHKLDIYHRDLKPDNVILKHGDLNSAVLVDFGMSWSKRDEDITDFKTNLGQEIGNRFLRLPEYVPGRHMRDSRSDLTMAIGLLFYMLTGQAPRALHDANGAMPHEVMEHLFSKSTMEDPRWPRLLRVFNVGFQENIDQRFSSCDEILERLNSLSPQAGQNSESQMQEELGRLNDFFSSQKMRELAAVKEVLHDASTKYLTLHHHRLQGTGFVSGGGGPNIVEGGRAAEFKFFIVQQGASEPMANFSHRIDVEGNELVARVWADNYSGGEYYRGPISDKDSLFEAVELRVPIVLTALFRTMHTKLQSYWK